MEVMKSRSSLGKVELNLRELRNRTEVSGVTYEDTIDIYDALQEKITKSLTESGTGSYNVKQLASTVSGIYANFIYMLLNFTELGLAVRNLSRCIGVC